MSWGLFSSFGRTIDPYGIKTITFLCSSVAAYKTWVYSRTHMYEIKRSCLRALEFAFDILPAATVFTAGMLIGHALSSPTPHYPQK